MVKKYTGWAYISGSAGEGADGPVGAIQYRKDSGTTEQTGSVNLTFIQGSSTLFLTGAMHVSGTITSNNYDVVNHTVSYLSASGDSKFGDTADDLHQFTGSVAVQGNFSNTGNTTLGDASGDSLTINAQTINIPNVAAGTDNTVIVYNGSTLLTDEIDSRVWGSTLLDASGTPSDNQVGIWTDANTLEGNSNLTFDGITLTGSVTGSLAEFAILSASALQVGSVTGSLGEFTTLSASALQV